MGHGVDMILDAKCVLGEGPIWDPHGQVLYWVNILAKQLHVYNPSTRHDRVIELDYMPGTVVMRKSGGLMLATDSGFASFDLDGQLEFFEDPEADQPGNRFNDGKCDPAGRFWAGTMPFDGDKASGSLYCLDVDHTVRRMLSGVTISNGLAWSEDASTMYYIDTMAGGVDAFDFDLASGQMTNRRQIIRIEHGHPDGMTIDADGKLWVAHFGGSRVTCWDPMTARQLDQVDLPVSNPTACWFGGKHLDELYITTAREGLDDAAIVHQPLAGGLFCTRPGVLGLEAACYAG